MTLPWANGRSAQDIPPADAVVSGNGSQPPQWLWSDAADGPAMVGYVADSERDEAAFVAEEVARLTDEGEAAPGQVAVCYRTNAQSRVIEEVFIRAGLPYKVAGGVRFYKRREVRDLLAYLRLIANPGDQASLRRILNVPRRGIGGRAQARIAALAQREKVSFAAALARPGDVPGLAGRSVTSIEAFNELIDGLRAEAAAGAPVAEIAEAVLERSGYLAELEASADLPDASRIGNLNELISVAREFDATAGTSGRDDPEAGEGAAAGGSLADFLAQVSLVAGAGQVPGGNGRSGQVTLMTLHTAKDLEFPVVFLTGLEENVFPCQRTAGGDKELQEERRLACTGFTCAERRLYLTRALTRTCRGRPEYHAQSRFLVEVPEFLIEWRRDQKPAPPAAAPPPRRSRLGAVVAIAGVGLLLVGIGDALGRTGHRSPVVPLFLAGLTLIFAPCAWRLAGTTASRTERLWVSVILGLGLLASYIFRSPLIFDNFDELAHSATLTRLLDTRALFQANPILPVSPYYPGIQLVTAATKWLTGLPLLLDQMVVLALTRIVTVLGVFLIVERACHSPRAGGVGALVYAANPEFYSLGAQYGYQTLSLAFAVAVVYLLFVAIDTARPKLGGLFALALISIGGMVVSHHVTAWLTIGFLVVWAAGLRAQAGISPRSGRSARRKRQARIVGLAGLAGVVLAVAWIAFLGHVVTGYIDPIIQAGARNVAAMVSQLHGNRQLFQNSAGGGTQYWDAALILASAVFFCLIILVSLYAVIWKKSVRGGLLRYLPAAIAATYPLAMLSNISSDAKEIGARTTTFIFFGVAVVVGGWLAGRLLKQRRVIEAVATIGVGVVCFLGSTLYGGGPVPALVNGPYIVGAHERSLGSPSLALANWASAHLPAGARVAADRDNSGLLNSFGQVIPVSPLDGSANPAPLFFTRQLTPSDISLIRKDDIRYIVTDTRLTEGLPLYGAYIAPGETGRPTLLTAAELGKFSSARAVYRIYDNGPIQVYDLSRFLGKRPLAVPTVFVASIRATGADVVVLVLALLVAAVWLWRLRRRARLVPIGAHQVVCGMVWALAAGLFGAFVILLLHLPPGPVAILALLALLILGLWPVIRPHVPWGAGLRRAETQATGPLDYPHGIEWYTLAAIDADVAARPSRGAPGRPHRAAFRFLRARAQLVLGCAGLVLVAGGASFAVGSARAEWVPPPELSIAVRQGQPVASVDLGTAAGLSARLAVATGGRVRWSVPLSSARAAQNVVLPAAALRPGSHVLLVVNGRTIRTVSG